ncbi:phosphoesterase [Vibrio splendidus]|uniref:phosphoesterase n=1 Tax=Vibrio splendidus TaxID=29497 RepID=UPI000C8675AF|nr:phosphoesterase [Vibrio splendidus]MDH5885450.1 hypothetical protein [Vibrio splendidus]PMG50919.1 hypothetical protein BCU89_04095 [Vibrio splendidus]TVU71819.1 phosphoesterase [Vibrio tasmaniensis]
MDIKFGQKLRSENLKGKIWLTSDLHFFHDNVLKFQSSTRPFESVEDMNEAIIFHWNSVVSKDDIVIDLGDMFFSSRDKCEAILKRLKGTIIHLAGNHSKVLRNQLWNSQCYDHFEFSFDGNLVVLNHYPMRVWNRSHYSNSFHFFGHCHGSLEPYKNSLDVGWDVHQRLLTLQDAIDLAKKSTLEDKHAFYVNA